ncbi:E3 ubiquitin-protein ligase RNF10 isoform X2 [Malaya genurostris]|uniref:E3 ubiquitin-protein ligase RNF10 isoform X2 n=1 Tax=Malaya genurostris TaxID=325434 RepID=UPI0026F3DC6D|nr:E3 ubiquitin-protein ligase RNF10 isoform X2 [Malaya genurostris]
MEKNHRFSNQNLSEGQISEVKKSQVKCNIRADTPVRRPRQSKRREQSSISGFKSENNRNSSGKNITACKTRNQTNYNYDKRSKQRLGDNFISENEINQTVAQYKRTGLATPDLFPARHELQSVYSPGSKKQSLNHLLNFHYAPRENDLPMRYSKTGNNRTYMKKGTYNKEQFLQANCQFVVRDREDYTAILADPDLLVDWNKIEQINILGYEEPQCPICLYPPVAAKMTKCGHVYCWPCILHYLALSDKSWRKCPICYDAIHLSDLRSAVSKPFHSYTIGECATFQLMRRAKVSMNVVIAADVIEQQNIPFYRSKSENTTFSKLLLADKEEILNVIAREQEELENQMVVDGNDCPENMFVHQALDQLTQRKEHILSANANLLSIGTLLEENNKSRLKESNILMDAACNTQTSSEANIAECNKHVDFMIDEDSNLLLSDIDIVPTATCVSSDFFYFYQSIDGQPLYLHSLNTRMLQAMYGSLDKSPDVVIGKIVHKDSCSMSDDLRKRLKYLQHLPVCTSFEVVEIEFENGIISSDIMAKFKDEVSSRRKNRQKRAHAERIRERKILEFNERQLGKSLARSAKIPINSTKHFPSCGDSGTDISQDPPIGFSPPTTDMSASPSLTNAGPSWSKMLGTSSPSSSWPSLPSGGTQAISTPKLIQVTGSKMTISVSNQLPKLRFPSESDCEDNIEEHYANRASHFGQDFSCAIGAALERVTLNCEHDDTEEPCSSKSKVSMFNNGNTVSGTKKKKNKKTLLFASGMNLY